MKPVVLVLLGLVPAASLVVSGRPVSIKTLPMMNVFRSLQPGRIPSVVGLVGGIASGKSTVSRILGSDCGVAVIDADKLGHESYEPGTRCFNKLVEEFGDGIVSTNGTIDRRALGQIVFGNPANMDRLQHIVWPEIRELARQRIEKLGEKGIESVVLEAAVLLEAGWDNMCDEVWVVQVPPDVARARLMKRNSFSEEEARQRIASQKITNEQRAARAAVVISNEGTEEELVEKVKRTWADRSAVLRGRKRPSALALVAVTGAIVAVAAASMIVRRGRGLR